MAEEIEYEFENTDEELIESDEEDEAAKAFRARWVGVANGTNQSFMVQVSIDASIPDKVTGKK